MLISEEIKKKDILYLAGLNFSARWIYARDTDWKGLNLIILPDKEEAEYCSSDLYNLLEGDNVFFLPDSGKNIERSNYKSSLNVQRTSAVEKISSLKKEEQLFVVSYPSALEEKLPGNRTSLEPIISFTKGQEVSHDTIEEKLFEEGFKRVDFVSEPGQYTIRGGIVDIFSYSYNNPFRLSFFGNEIDKINVFNCNTQLSIEKTDHVDIFRNMEESDDGSGFPITDIFPDDTLVWLDSYDLYEQSQLWNGIESFKKIFIGVSPQLKNKVESINFNIAPQPVFNKNFELLVEDIKHKIEHGYKLTIYGDKQSQITRLESIISQNSGIMPEFCAGVNLHSGFIDHDRKECLYTDHQIFDRFHRVAIRRSVEKSEQLTVNDLAAFSIGDYIVHVDYGVGIFGGLVRMKDDKGRIQEVIKLQYRDNDVVFISVHSLHKISKYKSKDAEAPRINKLGSKAWANLKLSAKSKVKDIAKDLIKLYAKRKATKGFAFSADTYLQEELESSFMYEDTPDQEKATKAVKLDMEDTCPMDRLVCGDVGFGKTEIAIRAAFKAVADSKQVAVLVPTTILALQHYNTFRSRLENFPCNIEFVSRLRTAKETSDIQKKLKEGKIDIVIGTHKLLGNGFEFKDLGLLIIDEEQKFGVSAKEKLRELKAAVDTLTLTATPIPRTLQFSLLGARDLSIINTPPPNRIPVQTEIISFDTAEIKSIINYELNRGGQIFFVHNRVEELESIRNILHGLVPDMKICVAHGQMESKELENKILDFMDGDYNMLLCTTIIENGLDIPNANTMIINQAQNIGLSDLHQLRGRVGRSNRRAFCYLVVPPLASVTDEARRRLKAIEAFSDLGSGFNIAMQDLDIRGAGNLLGAQQSGFISDMGFETYQKVLSEAMEELGLEYQAEGISAPRSENVITDCIVETDQRALIPDEYISITSEKIRIYKELDSAIDEDNLIRVRRKLEDRFGHMPDELDRLFDIVRIRQLAQKLGFEKVIVKNGIMIMFFVSNSMSPYYKSSKFADVLSKINAHTNTFELKQTDGKLKLLARNIESLAKAFAIMSLLS